MSQGMSCFRKNPAKRESVWKRPDENPEKTYTDKNCLRRSETVVSAQEYMGVIMDRVRRLLNIDAIHGQNITGKGVGVAVLDTGIFLHGDLHGRVDAVRSMVYGNRDGRDDNGHGTHICGIIAGDGSGSRGRYRGMAPEASIISVKVLGANGTGKVRDVEKGIDWVISHRKEYNIRIVNISIGTPSEQGTEKDRLLEAVNALWDCGVVVVAASGNNGPSPRSITVPGSSPKVITVGASDDQESIYIHGKLKSRYSGCGPTADQCIVKPEIVAPGSRIVSLSHRHHGYTVKSGTSMATPVAAGALALLLQKYPELTPKDVKKRLYETSTDLHLPREKQGWGMIHVQKLLES